MALKRITTPGTAARLSVNLKALVENYKTLSASASSAQCAGVVKADAYGLGLEPVANSLWSAGCRIFFVALLCEAEVLRQHLPRAEIYVLDGLLPGAAPDYELIRARPVLASNREIEEWSRYCRKTENRLPAAINIDTGINRLGLDYDEAQVRLMEPNGFQYFDLCLVMSHFACADVPLHPLNAQQFNRFRALRNYLPKTAFSLANSAGTLASKNYHFDIVRPGIALYGGNPFADHKNPMKPVVTLDAAILQVRDVAMGQSIGYGATFTCKRATKIAVLGLGYADGYSRHLSGSDKKITAEVMISGHKAPVVGRVSMDMIGVDVTDLPDGAARRGMMVEVIGENISLDGVAQASQTISYEVLTRLGNRFTRVYSQI